MTGITAEDRAPAATSWNTRSGRRKAAKKVSSSEPGQAAVDDDDDPEPAEDARDEEGARDDQPGPGEGARRGHACGSAVATVPAGREARGCAPR